MRARRFWASLLLLGLTASPGSPAPLDVSKLPTPVERWRWEGSSQSLLASGDLLFVAGKGRVSALDPDTGEILWSTAIGTEGEDCGCGHGAHVLIDDRLFVPIADSVAVLDTDDGTLVGRTSLGGGSVSRVLGPPVLASAHAGEGTILMRFDERIGTEIARLELRDEYGIELVGNHLVVTLRGPSVAGDAEQEGRDDWTEESTQLVGLDENLQTVWTRDVPGWAHVDREGDELVVSSYYSDATGRRPLNAETGEIGPALDEPEEEDGDRRSLRCGEDGTTDSFELAQYTDESRSDTVAVERPGPHRWRLDLPGSPRECDPLGEHLLLRLDRNAVRDLLAVVDARTGTLENLTLLPPGAESVLVAAGHPVLETETALVGIDPLRRGPAEVEQRSLPEMVRQILAIAEDNPTDQVVAELESLGPEVVPIATEILPTLDGDALYAAASLVSRARYAPAAAPLAAAIDRVAPPTASEDPGREVELVHALAAIAGPDQVDLLGRYAGPEGGSACLPSLAALGRIGTPAALQGIDRATSRNGATDNSWFEPPAAPRLGPLAPAEAKAALERLQASESEEDLEWEDLLASIQSVELAMPDSDDTLEVFTAEKFLQYDELWIAEPAPEGEPRPVFFLGVVGPCGKLEAEMANGFLEVGCVRPDLEAVLAEVMGEEAEYAGNEEDATPRLPTGRLRLEIGSWRADRDGDGLTDLFESYLGLDPERKDSDADGLTDGSDPAPGAWDETPGPQDPEADLVRTALATLWACDQSEEPVLLVGGAPALEWRRPGGVTLAAPPEGTRGRARSFSSVYVTVDPENPDLPDDTTDFGPLAPNERLVTIRFGPEEYSSTVALGLRRAAGRWIVTRSHGVPHAFYWFD